MRINDPPTSEWARDFTVTYEGQRMTLKAANALWLRRLKQLIVMYAIAAFVNGFALAVMLIRHGVFHICTN